MRNVEIQTTRHIFLGDLLDAFPEVDSEAVWQAVNDSDISFGTNSDTFMNKNDLISFLDDEAEGTEELLASIPDDVFISLGS